MLTSEKILNAIQIHKAKNNGAHPTTRQLAAVFGCSHVAVSNRLNKMVVEGFIDKNRNETGTTINGEAPLTPRQAVALELVKQGLTNGAIAAKMNIAASSAHELIGNLESKGLVSRENGKISAKAA